MKIAFTADIHAHNHTAFAKMLPNGRNSRLQSILDVFKQIVDKSAEQNVSHLVVVGDMFHARARIDVDVLYGVAEVLRYATDRMAVTLIVGNHDQYSRDGRYHSLAPFLSNESGRCVVMDHAAWFPSTDATFRLACMPFCDTREDFDVAARLLGGGKPGFSILAAHLGIDGAVSGPDEIPVKESIPANHPFFKSFEYVILGHYHGYQILHKDGTMFYVGSPLQHNFGERNEVKGFSIIDTETHAHIRVPLDAPKFRAVKVADITDLTEKDYYRIEVSTPEERDAMAQGGLPDNIVLNENFTSETVARADMDLTMSFETMVDKYVDHVDHANPFTPGRTGTLKTLGKEILRSLS